MHVQSFCFGYKIYCFFDVLVAVAVALLKRRRQRQRERHKTIGLMSKNNRPARALYVFVDFFAVISKTTTEMTKFKVLWRALAHDGEFLIFLPYLNAVPINLVPGYFGPIVEDLSTGIIAK